MLNFSHMFLFFIALSFVLSGCDSHECKSEVNLKAEKIIETNLNHLNNSWIFTCAAIDSNRLIKSLYGASNDDVKTLSNNSAKAVAEVKGINLELNLYKEAWTWGSNPPPTSKKPFLIISINN